jgi:uncharacterized CHY-type Zn-finger protein
MIQCPKCRQFHILEELRVPVASEKSTGVLNPKARMLWAILVTLGAVGLVVAIGGLLPPEWGGKSSLVCLGSFAAIIFAAFPFIYPRLVFRTERPTLRDEFPCFYQRTCESCGHQWMRQPGEPQSGLGHDDLEGGLQELRGGWAQRERAAALVEREATQTFICPSCGHVSTFDPRTESTLCPYCGFAPPTTKGQRTHEPLLDELLSHWNDTHIPEHTFTFTTPGHALLFFRHYQRTLGEEPVLRPGERISYWRTYDPERQEILAFAEAYQHLRRGARAKAAARFQALIKASPRFVDAWVWLTATTEDPAIRQKYLEQAVLLEPGHPLARDTLALATEETSLAIRRQRPGLESDDTPIECSQCKETLSHETSATIVVCPLCGEPLVLQETGLGAAMIE